LDYDIRSFDIHGMYSRKRLNKSVFLRYYFDLRNAFGRGRFLEFNLNKKQIPLYNYGGKLCHNPTFVGWHAISVLQRYLATSDKRHKRVFLNNADWFVENARSDKKLGIVWDSQYDWHEGRHVISGPWRSALGHGVALSVLTRAYLLTGKKKYLDLARKSIAVFSIPVEQGGVRSVRAGSTYYEEFPVFPSVNIFDGFVFSLLGLYDLYVVTGDKSVLKLYDAGVRTVVKDINQWDFLKMWSYYGSHKTLSPPAYNRLNSMLLYSLYQISVLEHRNQGVLKDYSAFWDARNLGIFKRAVILASGHLFKIGYTIRMIIVGGNY
jgi:hypothetical protein